MTCYHYVCLRNKRSMKQTVLLLAVFLLALTANIKAYSHPPSPKDFIITHSGDTTYGHIKRWGVFFGYRLWHR